MIRIDEGVKRKRPSVASVIWTLVYLGCLVLFSITVHAGWCAGSDSGRVFVHYTVGSGDTVWSISERIGQAQDVNPEAVVETVDKVNALNDGQVWPGMTILVPGVN